MTHLNPAGSTVDIIHTISDRVDNTPYSLPGGESLAPALSPDGKTLYVLPLPWNVTAAISTVGGGVLGSVGVGNRPIDQIVSPADDRLYVLNQLQTHRPDGSIEDGSISVVDTSTFQVVATIDLTKAPASGR